MDNSSIRDFLYKNGASMHMKGFLALCESIRIVSNDYSKVFNLKRDVYNEVARMTNSTSDRVSRNIRTVIESMFNKGDSNLYSIFNINTLKDVPTNKEFIAIIAAKFM